MQLYIEKLIFGGLGIAHHNNETFFVEDVLPGELVEAKVLRKSNGIVHTYPIQIIEPSTHRREPRCIYYSMCGGCDWQHIDYSYQLLLKRDIFIETLQRIGKIYTIPEIEIIHSQEWNYRIRAQVKIDMNRRKGGFYKKSSSDIIAIDHCLLLDSPINDILKNQDTILTYFPKNIQQIRCLSGDNGTITTIPLVHGFSKPYITITVENFLFSVSGNSFFQCNKFLLSQLFQWVQPLVAGNYLFDMYGGVGFFSLLLSPLFKRGLLLENVREQVSFAKKNFTQNNVNHFNTYCGTAENYFKKRENLKEKPDCLLVDPPRSGLAKSVRHGIADLNPNQIVYFSCNPSTQARDIGFFIRKNHYTIKKAAIFDLYPQTHHMETALLLHHE